MAGQPGYLLSERTTADPGSDVPPEDDVLAFTVLHHRVCVVQMSFAQHQWPRYEQMFRAVVNRFSE